MTWPRACGLATSTSTIRLGTQGFPSAVYKQSGNGREYAEYGLEDFLEIKGIAGYEPATLSSKLPT